jgi:hypothetical protein
MSPTLQECKTSTALSTASTPITGSDGREMGEIRGNGQGL